jgi:antirestriction protein ArdC
MAQTKQRTDHYSEITAAVLASLEAGVKPWARPWKSSGPAALDAGMPFNAESGRNYRGANVPLLWMVAASRGYQGNAWVTFKGAQALGGTVRKGEKASHVYYFAPIDRTRTNDSGEQERDRFLVMRTFCVFHVDQCDGVRLPERRSAAPADPGGTLGPVSPLLARLGLSGGFHEGGDSAFYAPSADTIHVPRAAAFSSLDAYRATVLHECGHATGHETRLKRDLRNRYGTEAYGFEELVAELTSAFTQAALGLTVDLEGHASYLDSWLRILRGDKRAFVKAASLAQAASDHLLPPQAGADTDEETQPAREPMALAA